MRLNAYIAKSGFCSRRKAAEFVKKSLVRVNGKTVVLPWHEIKDKDTVEVNGKRLNPADKRILLLFNKPKGVTTTLKDRHAGKKVTDFIPKKYGRVYPVGRLDKNSRGLILLTNDGNLCYELTHPKFEVEKEYDVLVEGRPGRAELKELEKGKKCGGDLLKARSARIIKTSERETLVKVIVHEGKKRHLRRLFAAAGFAVLDLTRVRIGNFKLGTLKEGELKLCGRDAAP